MTAKAGNGERRQPAGGSSAAGAASGLGRPPRKGSPVSRSPLLLSSWAPTWGRSAAAIALANVPRVPPSVQFATPIPLPAEKGMCSWRGWELGRPGGWPHCLLGGTRTHPGPGTAAPLPAPGALWGWGAPAGFLPGSCPWAGLVCSLPLALKVSVWGLGGRRAQGVWEELSSREHGSAGSACGHSGEEGPWRQSPEWVCVGEGCGRPEAGNPKRLLWPGLAEEGAGSGLAALQVPQKLRWAAPPPPPDAPGPELPQDRGTRGSLWLLKSAAQITQSCHPYPLSTHGDHQCPCPQCCGPQTTAVSVRSRPGSPSWLCPNLSGRACSDPCHFWVGDTGIEGQWAGPAEMQGSSRVGRLGSPHCPSGPITAPRPSPGTHRKPAHLPARTRGSGPVGTPSTASSPDTARPGERRGEGAGLWTPPIKEVACSRL